MDTQIPPSTPVVTRKRYFILIAVALFCIGLISWAGSVKTDRPVENRASPEDSVPTLTAGVLP